MTLEDYIKNPMGKKSAVFGMREMLLKQYEEKYKLVMLRENGKMEYRSYKGKAGEYYIYIKIPSETVEKFYYDLVFRFSPPVGSLPDALKSLDKYEFQVFSNDPAFVYTFAHAFHKNKLFLEDFSSKMDKLALKTAGEERNPSDMIGYVKTIIFAYYYMRQKNLFSKVVHIGAEKYNKKELLQMIEDTDIKIAKRKEFARTQNRKKKLAEEKRESSVSGNVRVSNVVQRTGHTKTTSRVSRTRKTGHSKKV